MTLKALQNAITKLKEMIEIMPIPTARYENGRDLPFRIGNNRPIVTLGSAAVFLRRPLLYQGPPTDKILERFRKVRRNGGFKTKQLEIKKGLINLDFYNVGDYTCHYKAMKCNDGTRVYFVLKCKTKTVTTEVQCTSATSPLDTNVDVVTITKFLVADHSSALHALQCILKLYANPTFPVEFQYNVHHALRHDAMVNDDKFEKSILRFLRFRTSKDKSLSRLTLTMPTMKPWLGIDNPGTLCPTISFTQIAYALYRYGLFLNSLKFHILY